MTLLSTLGARIFDAVDAIFEALGSIYRVILRGAFAPDPKTYRGSRYALLGANDVLVQEISLNASDQAEARKIITLDPEATLPLSQEIIAFDVVGPLEKIARLRASPERSFLLGVARREGLARARSTLAAHRKGVVEAFTYSPNTHPEFVFVFGDDAGQKRRRLRRAVTAIAFLAFVVTGADALDAGRAALQRSTEAADAERLHADRRIRLAERRALAAEASLASTAQSPPLSIRDAAQILTRVAQQQPAETETSAALLENGMISISGLTHDAEAAELQFRRAFERQSVLFSVEQGAVPQAFSVQVASVPERER